MNLNFNIEQVAETPEEVVASIRHRVEELALTKVLQQREEELREEFSDCFPLDIPHIDNLFSDTYHRF